MSEGEAKNVIMWAEKFVERTEKILEDFKDQENNKG